MDMRTNELSRISKLIVDRDQTSPDQVLRQRQAFGVRLVCGDDVRGSRTLQLAALTAANIAIRCFPGAARISCSPLLDEAPLLIWPWLEMTFGEAIREILGPSASDDRVNDGSAELLFGKVTERSGALRVTFDGWIAKVGPSEAVQRLPEREYFSAAGILAASLALSEVFLSFANISLRAARRVVALSLWRPELDISHPDAIGCLVEFLPCKLWFLGLGHLGNAYIWTVASLPFFDPAAVEFGLMDFDRIEKENVETGLIFADGSKDNFKTRACNTWLARRSFETRLVERRFDENFQVQPDEPVVALCGFDKNEVRRQIPKSNFHRVIDAGLGGTVNNFDSISVRGWPNPRPPEDLWPDLSSNEAAKIEADHQRIAEGNPVYRQLTDDECGRRTLAGKSIAVPFVGATAASFAAAELLRMLHGGPSYSDLRFSLGDPSRRSVCANGTYGPQNLTGLEYAATSRAVIP